MKQTTSYISLCTPNLNKSINFYEDMFGFVPEQEKHGYAFLRHKDDEGLCLELIEPGHEALPRVLSEATRAAIVTFPVPDIQSAWDNLFHEGVALLNDITLGACGQTHFFAQDPHNPVVIKIVQRAVA